jgi:hypothetical protein
MIKENKSITLNKWKQDKKTVLYPIIKVKKNMKKILKMRTWANQRKSNR